MKNLNKLLTILFTAAVMLAAVGCGGAPDDIPKLGTVTGVVTMDDNPLSNCIVTFQPNEKGAPSSGKTNDKGEYELAYRHGEKGAKIGTHKVIFTTLSEGPGPGGEPVKDPIPEKYNEQTEYQQLEVVAGENKLDFKLTSN